MKLSTGLLRVFVLFVLAFVRHGQAGLVTLGSKVYYIEGANKLNWYAAWNFCTSQGMTLLTVESKSEQDLLYNYLKHTGQMNFYWTSGNDNAEYRRFTWASTGKPFIYTNWHPGEPLNAGGKEHCVVTWPQNLDWNDTDCSLTYLFICETKSICT